MKNIFSKKYFLSWFIFIVGLFTGIGLFHLLRDIGITPRDAPVVIMTIIHLVSIIISIIFLIKATTEASIHLIARIFFIIVNISIGLIIYFFTLIAMSGEM
ncbi:MAG: hypothetical protein PHE25_02270 [Candidatus Gracilibacteria bacterium]|nr:hypothetical protein [Candidatus Gracilibacteria bacterium]